MDSDNLSLNIDYVASSGVVLSVEQKAALYSSLVILKSQQKFQKVQFVGKVLGTRNDYFLVQGVGKDELKDRKTLYSLDCVKWGLMSSPNEETRRKCMLIKGRFIGDPSHEYEHPEKNPDDDEGKDEESAAIMVKEEDRLAVTIQNIFQDVAIVPRGAYVRTAVGEVHTNRTFEGLSPAEATRLSSYYHFREPVLLHEKSLLEKADLDKATDFLDPIETDIPQGGSWSVQSERGGGVVVLRSLHWLGYTFYHVPNTSNFGYVYVGTGEKNLDLPFML
ncbi:radial spoke head protein 9 homolog [Hydractinia symbiolongicarpus]|uniref:radial spoke head protein 9 homolog n=1 Tax=Hydractinia symbiolongicarpus TaxID=13093 RepID=UPI0025504F8D|nr:radial spoke head protein 9 homolog [Hydractinia symbiolongicarpus]